MNNTLVQANDCLFQVKIDDDYVTVLCAKSFTVTVNTDEKEITTVGDGAYKSFDYKVLSYTANLNGVMRMPDGATTTAFDWVNYQQSFYEVPFRVAWIDPSGVVRTFKGTAIIKANNLVASASQVADATVDLLGTGPFEIGDALEEFVNLTIVSQGNNSVPAFIKFWLLNEDGDTIFLTDTTQYASGSMLGNPLNITIPVPRGIWYFYYYVDTNSVGNDITVTAPPGYTAAFNNGVTQFNTYPNQSYDFTADRSVTINIGINNPPPTCVAPSIPGSPALPDATEAVQWAYSFPINGSGPFSITNVTKPAWMSITTTNIGGVDYVQLSGNPSGTGIGQVVEFDLTNACGTVQFSDLFNVLSNPNAVTINWSFTEFSSPYSFVIFRNAVQVVSTDVPASGTLIVNNGDAVSVRIVGPLLKLKQLKVESSVSGVLYDQSSGSSILSYDFTATVGHVYTVTATGLAI